VCVESMEDQVEIAPGWYCNSISRSDRIVFSNLETDSLVGKSRTTIYLGGSIPDLWRIGHPDIYENSGNQRKFGMFLEACLTATREDQILAEISRLADAQIKGLSPAVASIVYFLHPTMIPPSNTAMVYGFNSLFGAKIKLGSWASYLEMRETILRVNSQPEIRSCLSKDLGAFAGLLFEIGTGRLLVDGSLDTVLQTVKAQAEKAARLRHKEVISEEQEQSEHTHIQYLLIKIGRALNFDVYVAKNDRHRSSDGEMFSMLTVPELPSVQWSPEVQETIGLIDVIWIKRDTGEIVSAFEVEKSTSIY
jgi:type II restriction enzyme